MENYIKTENYIINGTTYKIFMNSLDGTYEKTSLEDFLRG